MPYELIAIGASWGGLVALERVLGGLPAGFEAAVVVAQHRSADSQEGLLTEVLATHSALPVREAADKDLVRPGCVYLAPPDYHLLVEPGALALSVDEKVSFSRPSIDVLLESAGDAYGERAIGVVLTGSSDDGALGLRRLRERGGLTIVQDPDEAERPEMPAAAVEAGAAGEVRELASIAPRLRDACGAGRPA